MTHRKDYDVLFMQRIKFKYGKIELIEVFIIFN
jgi:hypothetical protein